MNTDNTPTLYLYSDPQVENITGIKPIQNKLLLRAWAKEKRKNLDIQTLSENLVEKLKKNNEYIQAKNIMIFYPKQYEVNLLKLLDDESKNFYLPKIDNNELLCCPYRKGEDLYESCFKTKEPYTQPIDKSIIDLVIVPALAIDKNNYRLGYGGGFYDRLLKDMHATKIACISSKLIIDTVEPESHDIRMDFIISV